MRWLVLCLIPLPAFAEALVTNKIVKVGQVIDINSLAVIDAVIPGAMTDMALVVGQEARVTLYPGRPIQNGQFGSATLVSRNQIVGLTYITGTFAILTEGRALDRGGVGDVISILNLSSRKTVQGKIMADGTVRVGPLGG